MDGEEQQRPYLGLVILDSVLVCLTICVNGEDRFAVHRCLNHGSTGESICLKHFAGVCRLAER